MGQCCSRKVHMSSSKYAAASEPDAPMARDCRTPEDIEKVFNTFDSNGTGFIKEDQFDSFCEQVLGVPLDAEDREQALAAASTGGLITFRAFMDWFRNDDGNDEDALEITYEQVPESVRRGLKEDGVAAGAAEEELLSAGNGDDEMNDRNADGLVGFTHLADQR